MARTSKFIIHPSDEQLDKFPEEVRHLVKKGKQQGFVTHQELLKVMPNIEGDLILLDEVYSLFMDVGVEILDTKDNLILDSEELSPSDEKEEKKAKKETKKENIKSRKNKKTNKEEE